MEAHRRIAQDIGRVSTLPNATAVACALALLLAAAAVRAAATERPADELYAQHCAICHLPGIAGAPKVGDSRDPVLSKNYARFDADADGQWSVGEYENAEIVLEQERKAVKVEDGIIANSVRTALARVKGIDLAHTKIAVASGVVSITGIVEEPHTAIAAHDAVKRIPGVQKIDNRLVSGHQMGWD